MVINTGTHCYVGQLACGCGVSLVRDMPQFKKNTAKDVADMVKRGLNVTRLEHDAACAAFSQKCPAYPHEEWQKRIEAARQAKAGVKLSALPPSE